MMQYVATAKSEVAAFATGSGSSSLTEPQLNKQFDKLLQQSSDEINKVSSSAPLEYQSVKVKNTSNEHEKKRDAHESSLSQSKPVKLIAVEGDTSDIVTQEWVTLVDNLQKLADIAQLTQPPNGVDKEQIVDTTSVAMDKEQIVDTTSVAMDENMLLPAETIKLSGDISFFDDALSNLEKPKDPVIVDLTSVEDKSLLNTLLINFETDKSQTSEKPVQAHQVETKLNKTEKVASDNDIKNILTLPDKQLDNVLENIAQRLFDNKKSAEGESLEKATLPIVNLKSAESLPTQKITLPNVNSIESSSKDFISALKSGLEEFKSQLSQGREPGIDLKALVSDALAKTNESETVPKSPVNLEQLVKSVSQVLVLAESMNRAIEQNHEQTYSASLRDVTQIQGEQSRQLQSNQFESKFEKAINIAKPEGHQQLAEKVRWMINTKNLVAEIRLDPAELGSMHVKIGLSGESATVNFVVQSQQARDAVDTATPKLRELLAEKGIELGQSSVRQESDGQQDQSDGELSKQGSHSNDSTENVEVPEQAFVQQNIINGALGGIDYFV